MFKHPVIIINLSLHQKLYDKCYSHCDCSRGQRSNMHRLLSVLDRWPWRDRWMRAKYYWMVAMTPRCTAARHVELLQMIRSCYYFVITQTCMTMLLGCLRLCIIQILFLIYVGIFGISRRTFLLHAGTMAAFSFRGNTSVSQTWLFIFPDSDVNFLYLSYLHLQTL